MVEWTTMLRQLCSTQHFRKGFGRSTSDKTNLETRRIKILVLSTGKETSIRKRDTIVHEKFGVTIPILRIHWSCFIANAHSIAHAVLDINKFVYT